MASNFETLNEFFTKFKHLVLQLKQCEVEKEDDHLILSILSKLASDYSLSISRDLLLHITGLKTPKEI